MDKFMKFFAAKMNLGRNEVIRDLPAEAVNIKSIDFKNLDTVFGLPDNQQIRNIEPQDFTKKVQRSEKSTSNSL